jgi:protein required for attachment to host cells
MKPTWIVVANAFQAQLYERAKPRDPLQALESLVHPESRLKSAELNDDQPGSAMTQGGGHTAYSPATEPKDKEQEKFARQIVERLQQGVRGDRCGALMLFASPAMLGMLRNLLDASSAKLIQHSAAIDLTAFSGRELEARIAQQLER